MLYFNIYNGSLQSLSNPKVTLSKTISALYYKDKKI